MRIHVDEVREVQLSDGWHEVVNGTFRLGPVQLTTGDDPQERTAAVEWPVAFSFETPDGEAFAGPLSSLLAVSHLLPEKPEPPAHEELARRLQGELVTVDGVSTVRFTHADHEFDVWLGDSGTWRYVESSQRTTADAVNTYLPESDVHALVSQMMADLKSTWGLGRPPGVPGPPGLREGRDPDAGPRPEASSDDG
ncbi:hypothetical protein DN069_09015 [Streptacidiphilus pinicola]|uniref:Uncharacterized protein n=1 Tax=Streptacidiphilus pinicola TaxID=2219663 RepID=A0A2X0IML2_9ACTN|nr:hypothetical protein [Streptacidiphilus pinicola]RAG85907.1 hypothetical protein DN069_09015 [Streptacidiphilus pinicola]